MNATNPEVDHFLSQLDHPFKKEIEQLRQVILNSGSDISEHIKWNAPSFGPHNDDRITFKLYPKDRISLVFHRGAKVKDSTNFSFKDDFGLLKWLAKDRALLTFKSAIEVKEHEVKFQELVKRWLHATL